MKGRPPHTLILCDKLLGVHVDEYAYETDGAFSDAHSSVEVQPLGAGLTGRFRS